MGAPLVQVANLTVDFRRPRPRGIHRAVDDVNFCVNSGETVGVVGESGAGKSTVGRCVLGLQSVTSGSILVDGVEVAGMGPRQRRRMSTKIQAVFQDPYGSLNPARTVGQSLVEPLWGQRLKASDASDRVREMLGRVGLEPDAKSRFPAEFSGGQRQRIAIARSLMLSPSLVVCDEPTSALDLSVQAQILNVLMDIQAQFGVSYLFISHDLSVVRHMASRVVVMNDGRVIESGETSEIYSNPIEPYTRKLIAAVGR